MIIPHRLCSSLLQILTVLILSVLLYACAKESNTKSNPFIVVFTKDELLSVPGRTTELAFSVINHAPSCTTVAGAAEFPIFKDLSSYCYLFFTDLTTNSIATGSSPFPVIEPLVPFFCDQTLTSSTTYGASSIACVANHIYQLSLTCTHRNNGSFVAVSPDLTCTP